MRAIQIAAFGVPEKVIEIVEVPEPAVPKTGEALLQVEYAPLDHHDLLLAQGTYPTLPSLPTVIGHEGVATVVSTGSGVGHIATGDRVLVPYGTYAWAERVVAPAAALHRLPDELDLHQAAMARINPTTAGLLLRYGNLPPGSWIVQNAANSGVGRSVIVLARQRGLRTINLVRRPELVDELSALGADLVVVAGAGTEREVRARIGDEPVLLGLDGVSGAATGTLIEVLTDGAVVVSYAHMSNDPFAPDPAALAAKSITAQGFYMYAPDQRDALAAVSAETQKLLVTGALALPVDAIYPFDHFAEALAHLRSGGKVLLDFNPERSNRHDH